MAPLRQALLVLVAGLLIAGGAYWGTYRAGTAAGHSLESSKSPELAWLKERFRLNDAEFERITRMHEAYLAGCAERCRLIDQKNQQLKQLLAATNSMTSEIARALSEAAQMRAECQQKMLEHFFAVSQTMPAEQASQYLAWVQERTVLANAHQGMSHAAASHEGMHGRE